LITNCKDEVNSSKVTFFNPENLSKLKIEDMDKFWRGDSIFVDDYLGYFFYEYDGYLNGVKNLNFSTHKIISVYVFKSREIAIEAIEEYRQIITTSTDEGDPNLYFNERWWYVIGSYNSIIVNKYNTFIQISNSVSENDDVVIETANEIISRIEKLSR
jgi:hypothetical protein